MKIRRLSVYSYIIILLAVFLFLNTSCNRDKPVICEPDIYEPNNSIGNGYYIGEVEDNSIVISAQISSENDVDFYKILAKDNIGFGIPGTPENFQISFSLIPSPGKDYDLYIYDDTGSPLEFSANRGSVEEVIDFDWVGTSGLVDDKYFVIEVRPYSGAWGCTDYTLSITML
jgi:hypothetical protein